jgi:hypothetical protein
MIGDGKGHPSPPSEPYVKRNTFMGSAVSINLKSQLQKLFSKLKKFQICPIIIYISNFSPNPQLNAFYTRLLDSSNSQKVVMVACMRKMLITLNAMLKKTNLLGPSSTKCSILNTVAKVLTRINLKR